MLEVAHRRGFQPEYVLFDSWYSGLDNLKAVRGYEWRWLTQLKGNRLVDPDDTGNVAVELVAIPPEGRIVHLKGYGFIKVFRTVAPNGDVEHWATNELTMTQGERERLAKEAWGIEEYHRGIKQCCGIERAQVRKATAQIAHILLALRAFVRLEVNRLQGTIRSWYDAKTAIIRPLSASI